MNNRNGALSFDAYIGDTDFNRTIQSMNKKLEGMSNKAVSESKKMESAFSNLGRLAAGGIAAAGLSQLPQQIVRVRGEFQQLETSFRVMLGSKEKADKLMADVVKFAATTPFDLAGVAGASKQLLAYGFASEEVIGTLRRLGDVASGLNIPLNELTAIYGKAKVGGRLYTEDFNQFIDRGIPLIQLLAAQFKIADSEVKKFVEDGKVGFADVEKAINTLTDAGGMFAGLTAENAKSLTGLYSNLEDSIAQAFNNIGKDNEGLLSTVITTATEVVENYETILDVLKVVIATYGTYRAALLLTAATQASSGIISSIKMWSDLAMSVKSAKDAQILFNLATKANPYVLAATAIVALAGAFALFRSESEEATKSQERSLVIKERLNQKYADETSKIEILTRQISSEARTRDERNAKLKELIAISPAHFNALTLDNIATDKGAAAIRAYSKALEEKLKLQASEEQIVANNKRIRDISTGVLDEEYKPGMGERVKLFLEDSGFDEKKFKATTEKRKRAAVEALKDENFALINEAAKSATTNSPTPVKPPVVPKPAKDKIKSDSKSESEVRIKTFAEELDEKKKLYELYERWVASYGKGAADEQFTSLVARNKDYVTYLNSEISRLEAVKNSGEMSYGDAADLSTLLEERTSALGGKSPIDQFREKLEDIRESSASLTDELTKLQEVQKGLNPADNSATGVAQRQALAERDIEVQKQRKQLLQDFLVNVSGSEEKRLEITKHYADLRAEIEKNTVDKSSKGYLKALATIDEKEKEELSLFEVDAVKASKGYKELDRIITLSTKNETKLRLDTEKAKLALLTKGTDEYIEQLKRVRAAEEDHKQHMMQTWQSIGGMIGDIGSSLEAYGGKIGEIGSTLSGVSSAVNKVSSAFANMDSYKTSSGKMSMDGYVAAAQNVIQIVTGIIDAQKRRRDAEKQFAAERIGFENEYQLSLNKTTGGDYKKNPFYKDYDGMIKAGVKQYSDAFTKYQAALDKLEEGRAKERQKNVVDGKTTLGMVGAGAAAGALIGAAAGGVVLSVPAAIVGTIVGGVVGFVGGLFAKKKKDVYGALMDQYPELVKETAEGWAELNIEMAQALITNNQVDDKTKEMLQNAIALNEAMAEAKQQIQDTMVELTGQVGDTLKNALVEAFRAGDSAAQAMHKTVSDIIADVTSKLLFSALVGPALDQLTKEMTASLTNGDGAIVDDLTRFEQYGMPEVEKYFQGLEEFDKWAKSKGFDDVFGRSKGANDQAMQGVIKGVSEESVSVLIGQVNAVRIYQADMANNTRISVGHLATIAQNTMHNRLLIDVVDRLERLDATSRKGFRL